MPDGGWRGLSRAKKEARSLKVGVRAVEMEQGKRDNPGEPEAQAERGNTYTMQGRCRRAQVHFWPIAIEVDGHCSASFLKFFTNGCNAAKELTEQNPQVPKLLSSAGGNASHVNFTKRMPNLPFNALLLPVVLCFAFLLARMMNCRTTSYKPICLLKSLIVVHTVIANGIPVTPGPPASARGTPVQLRR